MLLVIAFVALVAGAVLIGVLAGTSHDLRVQKPRDGSPGDSDGGSGAAS